MDLTRFVEAQDAPSSMWQTYNQRSPQVMSTYKRAIWELESGHKDSCWMWFIFPQEKHLGQSEKSQYYGLEDEVEAREYLKHPVLGPRWLRAINVVIEQLHDTTLEEILGELDAMKFRSSVNLLLRAASL